MPAKSKDLHRIWILAIAINLLFLACIINIRDPDSITNPSKQSTPGDTVSPSPPPQVEVIFNVEIPPETPSGQKIYLDILDELTGLALNPYRYGMVMIDSTHYSVHIAVRPNSMIKYRYLKEGNPPDIEHTTSGSPVRYRLYSVSGPGKVNDIISAWQSLPFKGIGGRIQGIVTDTANQPIPNILVAVGGKQTRTSATGNFLIEELPKGIHNLVAYSTEGQYETFQQGVLISPESTTPVTFQLRPQKLVQVTFIADLPPETETKKNGVVLRLVGDQYGLGNTFADLGGGINSTALQSKEMRIRQDGRFELTIKLAAGSLFRYKYSLGDGFWNSEQTDEGRFLIREITIPETNFTIEDNIQYWSPIGWGPITFNLTVPANTPKTDTVFIQFNPYGWTEPLPMIRIDDYRWQFTLFSPLHLLGSTYYRFCRNGQCESAGEIGTNGTPIERKFIPSAFPQTFEDEVTAWQWPVQVTGEKVTFDASTTIAKRPSDFWAGIEFQSNYHPSWLYYSQEALSEIRNLGSNWVVLTPCWTSTSQNLPVIEPLPGRDPLWPDMVYIGQTAQELGLNIALFPQINFITSQEGWWGDNTGNLGWWRSWFDRYKIFVQNFATLANTIKAGGLILGDPKVSPTLPTTVLTHDAQPLPYQFSENEWIAIITEIRSRQPDLKLLWVIEYPLITNYSPQFLENFDGFYILWNAPLNVPGDASTEALTTQIGTMLDENIFHMKEQTGKPMILAIKYPSIEGAVSGCIDPLNACLSFDLLDQPSSLTNIQLDFKEQAEIYQATFNAINQRPWINGVVSRGFYPPLALSDGSASIRGKPAGEITHYWFQKLFENTQ
ncbi:MAG: carboxypeptidase regulatory-like domain-containing protein [Anaerolineae bacterium]|nr:carboxypeptidase regulatory-like domain-containing protein [Anaerolineae bacterium]